MEEAYAGLFGAYKYAFTQSGSWIFRSYVIASAFVGVYIIVLLVLGLVTWLANPTGRIGEFMLLSVIGLLLIIPLFSPVLIVARRYRTNTSDGRADRLLGLAGYGFVCSILLALLISDPSDHSVGGIAGDVVGVLDSVPDIYGLLPPVIAVFVLVIIVKFTSVNSLAK